MSLKIQRSKQYWHYCQWYKAWTFAISRGKNLTIWMHLDKSRRVALQTFIHTWDHISDLFRENIIWKFEIWIPLTKIQQLWSTGNYRFYLKKKSFILSFWWKWWPPQARNRSTCWWCIWDTVPLIFRYNMFERSVRSGYSLWLFENSKESWLHSL